ncbi:MAG: hypothetical protein Q9227_006807 [Pyrenula ochraceoflavens]
MADPLSAISLGIRVAQVLLHYCKSFRGYDSEIDSFASSVERLKDNLQLITQFIKRPALQLDTEAKFIQEQLQNNVKACSAATSDLERELQKLQPSSVKSSFPNAIKKLGKQSAWHFRKESLPPLQKKVADILKSLEFGINHHQLTQVGFIRRAVAEMETPEVNTKIGYRVIFFYFQFNDNVNGSAEMLTKSLIYQLSFTSTSCASEVENLYESSQSNGEAPTLQELIAVLVELTHTYAEIFIVLDALDEASEPYRLWQVLKALPLTIVHLLLISRPNVDIRPEIQTLQPTVMQIEASKVDKDIRKIVRARLSSDEKLRLFSDSHATIESSLMKKAGGMFKLVDSQLDRLRACRTTAKVNSALESIPRDLNEIWNRCFKGISEDDLDDSIRLLTWLCFSQRPLRFDELIDALAIPEDWSHGVKLTDYRLKDQQALLDLGSGLVEIDQHLAMDIQPTKDRTVRLAHVSVKEWLQSHKISRMPLSGSLFTEIQGHSILADLCLRYLEHCDKEYQWTEQDFLEWPLAVYSALYWRLHLSKSDCRPKLIDLACKLLLNDTSRKNWRLILFDSGQFTGEKGWLSADKHMGLPLAYAAEYPLDQLVEALLCRSGANVNDRGLWSSPLEVAIRQNRLSTVEILVEHGAAVNSLTRYGGSLLSLACQHASLDVIQFLLDQGAVDNEEDFDTALVNAASREDDSIMRLLLDRGFDVNNQSSYGSFSALHLAALYLKLSKIKMLLSHGAKKEWKDKNGSTALHLAVAQKACTPEIAQLLYYTGAELTTNTKGESLVTASLSGNPAVCEMLLKTTPDTQIPKAEMTENLIKAATKGFLGVVDMLHQRGADFEKDGSVALIEAARYGHTDIVRFLLDHGQKVEVVGSDGRTAAHRAAQMGNFETLKFLVTREASLRAVDVDGSCVCHFAAASGQLEILQWFSEQGIAMSAENKYGSTPFLDAVYYGKLECAKFLSTLTPGYKTQRLADGRTVLTLAAQESHVDILKWLCEDNIDVNEQFALGDDSESMGEYALLFAVINGQFKAAEFLLENGANPDLFTGHGTTAILVSVRKSR